MIYSNGCVRFVMLLNDRFINVTDTRTNIDNNNNVSIIKLHYINLLKPTGQVMHQQFNIQQLYVLPTLYLCVLYLSENKQRRVPLTA